MLTPTQCFLDFLDDQPTAYYEEMTQFLSDEFGVRIERTQLGEYLAKAEYSRKAVRRRAAERNATRRTV